MCDKSGWLDSNARIDMLGFGIYCGMTTPVLIVGGLALCSNRMGRGAGAVCITWGVMQALLGMPLLLGCLISYCRWRKASRQPPSTGAAPEAPQ